MGTIIRSRVGLTANNSPAERKRMGAGERSLLVDPFESPTLINVVRVTYILSHILRSNTVAFTREREREKIVRRIAVLGDERGCFLKMKLALVNKRHVMLM